MKGKSIVGAALAGAALFTAAPAQADEWGYINDLQRDPHAVWRGTDDWFIGLGYAVCADLAEGASFSEAVDAIDRQINFDSYAATSVVMSAIVNLC